MTILEIMIGVIGLAMLSVSLVHYQMRTHDEQLFTRFWLSKGLLTSREYVLNRVGLALTVAVVLISSTRLIMAYLH